MTPEAQRWEKIRALFDAVSDSAPETWSSKLLDLCPHDPDIRTEALALLECDAAITRRTMRLEAPDLIDSLIDQHDKHETDSWIGRRLGAWRIVNILGRGGMGIVYRAERDDGEFRQISAIKLMRSTVDTERTVRNFRNERQILATLEHPNIAHLLDGGVIDNGIPWFALEYVEGVPITVWCDNGRLGVRERLNLFLSVCAAVAHAHERLVVHADLKPANILVNAKGEAKLLDFGIAKLVEPDGEGDRLQTRMRVFTPEYAPPEQIRGLPITTSVDVYALGVVLFEILTGQHPYAMKNDSPDAVAHAALTREPRRPSDAIRRGKTHMKNPEASKISLEIAQRRNTTLARLSKQLHGDLDAIVLKALRSEPTRRYASVREMAEDLRAAMSNRPVAARQGGYRYRAGRFLRRYSLAVGLGLLAFLFLTIGLAAALWQAREARLQRDAAERDAETAERTLAFVSQMFRAVQPNESQGHGRDIAVSDVIDQAARDLNDGLADQPEVRARLQVLIAEVYGWLDRQKEAIALTEDALGTQQKLYGRNAIQLAPTLIALANFRFGIQQDQLALDELERACSILADEGRTISAELLRCENDLVYARYAIDGDPERQGRAIETILDGWRSLPLEEKSKYPLFLGNLLQTAGALRREAGDLDAAKRLLEESLAERKATLKAPHGNIAKSLNTLAMTYLSLQENELADKLSRESLAMYEALGDHESSMVANQRSIVAQVTELLGRYDEAEKIYVQAINELSGSLGPQHTTTLNTRSAHARTLLWLGRASEANIELTGIEPLLRERGDKRALATFLYSKGELALLQKRYRDAVAAFEECAELRHDDNPTHWRTFESMSALGYSMTLAGDMKGRALLEDAVRSLRADRVAEDTVRIRAEKRLDLVKN